MAIGTTFIIDLWFTGIILAGLAACVVWRRSPVPAIAGLAALCAYVAFQGVLQQRAVEWGEAYARDSGLMQARVTAQPRPVSPFNWMVIVRSGEEVRYSFINLVRREPLRAGPDADYIARLDAAYLPLAQAQWVYAHPLRHVGGRARHCARRVVAAAVRVFTAGSPMSRCSLRVDAGNPSACAWFEDLRFFHAGARQLAVPLRHVQGPGRRVAAVSDPEFRRARAASRKGWIINGMTRPLLTGGRALALAALAMLALASCETVQTTQPGAVGVDRKQSMLLSSAQVNKSAAMAYQEELKKAAKKNALNRDAAQVARVRQYRAAPHQRHRRVPARRAAVGLGDQRHHLGRHQCLVHAGRQDRGLHRR